MSLLFSPYDLAGRTVRNRLWVAPMCQYSASEGVPNDWHHVHLAQFASGGAGVVIAEATAVVPEGRISPEDTGLWNDAQQQAWAPIAAAIRARDALPGIQLAHAGRKASTWSPFSGHRGSVPTDAGGWTTVAPSAVAFEGFAEPVALDTAGIDRIVEAFGAAAVRAVAAGFDVLEVHAAHGYLLHQFLSPLSNARDDAYGGSLENRMRLVLRVFDAVRAAVPSSVAVGVRISATDWVEGGWDLAQSVALARALDARGCHFIHVSSGGLDPRQQISAGPGYQVPFAEAIKAQVAMPVIAVGMITQPRQAEAVLAEGRADAVALARGILYDPRWPWHAAAELGASVVPAPQFLRCEPREARGVFAAA